MNPFDVKFFLLFSSISILPELAFSQVTLQLNGGAKIDSSSMATLRIDPENTQGAKVSQLFDEVNFIPLETTDESLFGRITEMKIIKGRFVIFDSDTKALLIFGPAGKFIAKINAAKISRDKNDDAKHDLFNFGIQSNVIGYQAYAEKGDTVLQVFSYKYCYYFDLAGKQIGKENRKDIPQNYTYLNFARKAAAVRSNYLEKRGKDSSFYETAIINGKDTVGYFPYSITRNRDLMGRPLYTNFDGGDEIYFTRYHNYNIYKATPEKVALAYKVLFPSGSSMPADFITRYSFFDKANYLAKNRQVYYGIKNFRIIGDKLFLQLENMGYVAGFGPKNGFIYNLKTNEVTAVQDLEPDSLSSFLPITDAGSYYEFNSYGFNVFKDGYLYTSYSSLAMFTYKEQLGDKQNTFSPAMQLYFKTQTKKSNPVIVQLKPKRN